MTLVNRADYMLLDADEVKIRGGLWVLHGGVPFVGPSHGHGDRVSGVDLHVHVAAPDSRIVDAASVEAGGLQGDRLAVGRDPVENTVLPESERGEGAEDRADDGGVSHNS